MGTKVAGDPTPMLRERFHLSWLVELVGNQSKTLAVVMELQQPQLRKRFGTYEFDQENCELKRNGIRLKIAGQPLEVLALLTERPGVLVTREELRQRLWPADTFVDFEHGLNTCIFAGRLAMILKIPGT